MNISANSCSRARICHHFQLKWAYLAADHTQVRATVSWTGFSGIPIKLNSSTCSKRVGKSEQALKRGCSLCVHHQCVCLWCCCHSFQEAGSHFLEICGQADKRTQTINFEQLSTRQSISVVTKVSLSFVFCSILQRQGPKRSLQSLEDCLQHNNNFACKKLNTHTPGKHKHWEQLNLAVKYIIEQLYYNVNIYMRTHS